MKRSLTVNYFRNCAGEENRSDSTVKDEGFESGSSYGVDPALGGTPGRKT